MNRQDFALKYTDAVLGIFEAGGSQDDTSVCIDKLISSVRGYGGETYEDGEGLHFFEEYPGIPEDFDYEEAYEDYLEMVQPEEA